MPYQLLLVDDSTTIDQAVSITFAKESLFQLERSTSPAELVATASNLQPDVILLDARLPKADSFQLCQQLKRNAPTSKVKVLILAPGIGEFDPQQVLTCGADGHVVKPFETQVLIDQIKTLVGEPITPSVAAVRRLRRSSPPAPPPADLTLPSPAAAPASPLRTEETHEADAPSREELPPTVDSQPVPKPREEPTPVEAEAPVQINAQAEIQQPLQTEEEPTFKPDVQAKVQQPLQTEEEPTFKPDVQAKVQQPLQTEKEEPTFKPDVQAKVQQPLHTEEEPTFKADVQAKVQQPLQELSQLNSEERLQEAIMEASPHIPWEETASFTAVTEKPISPLASVEKPATPTDSKSAVRESLTPNAHFTRPEFIPPPIPAPAPSGPLLPPPPVVGNVKSTGAAPIAVLETDVDVRELTRDAPIPSLKLEPPKESPSIVDVNLFEVTGLHQQSTSSQPETHTPPPNAADVEALVRKLTNETIERIVWEVVPQLAETMIRERLHEFAESRTKPVDPSS